MNKILKNTFAGLCALSLLTGCNSGGSGTTTSTSTSQNSSDSSQTSQSDSSSEDSSSSKEHEGPIRVLFLGNSLVFYNDMPKLFESLALYAGKDIYVDSLTQGSCTMSLFASETIDIGVQAHYKLQNYEWDYVIIEPSRRATPFEDTIIEAELEAAEKLDALIKEAGAETLIYCTWGLKKGYTGVYRQTGETSVQIGTRNIDRETHCRFIAEYCQRVSERIGGAKIIQAGYAFENSIELNPSLDLYYSDLQHPSKAGSYLVACTVYDTIFEEESVGIEYDADLNNAAYLQSVADLTMIEGVVPDLHYIIEPEEQDEAVDKRILLIGAPTIMRDDYTPGANFISLMEGLGKTAAVEGVYDGNFTYRQIQDDQSEKGLALMEMLAAHEFDAIIIQVGRRMTKQSSTEEEEIKALLKIKELLHSETDNIFIFAPKGDSNQTKFRDDGSPTYVSDGKDSSTQAEQCQYYDEAADRIAAAINAKKCPYSMSYMDYKDNVGTSKAGVGYLYACCFYSCIFNQKVPDTGTWINGLTTAVASSIREIAANHCVSE